MKKGSDETRFSSHRSRHDQEASLKKNGHHDLAPGPDDGNADDIQHVEQRGMSSHERYIEYIYEVSIAS